ncbi:hypothetical protein MHUMG1_02250 [Metarhizium humberi]|uniref:Uncharacterized protein n=1 Tax=Metarhizium humberi TaxID=2596975 RepID=A0A9P8S9W8_9HYPO|nr:hypothetical protein MHUMG1_02250 [Metarhizium humberi]
MQSSSAAFYHSHQAASLPSHQNGHLDNSLQLLRRARRSQCAGKLVLETGQEPTLLRSPELPLRIRRGTPAPCARTTKSACGRTLARQANKQQGNLMSHIFPDEICIQGEINPESWVDRIPKCGWPGCRLPPRHAAAMARHFMDQTGPRQASAPRAARYTCVRSSA